MDASAQDITMHNAVSIMESFRDVGFLFEQPSEVSSPPKSLAFADPLPLIGIRASL